MSKIIEETGYWHACSMVSETNSNSIVFIESEDFTHDARLYVNGDFIDDEHKFNYAEEIAKRLNEWQTQRDTFARNHPAA